MPFSTSNLKVGHLESNINFKNTKLTLPIYDVHDGHKTRLCYVSGLQVVLRFTIPAHVVCFTYRSTGPTFPQTYCFRMAPHPHTRQCHSSSASDDVHLADLTFSFFCVSLFSILRFLIRFLLGRNSY